MRQFIYLIFSFTLCLVTISCSNEDAPNADLTDPREHFIPSDNETDEASELRRSFNSEEQSFLLFNDTIQKIYNGKNLNGEDSYFVEVIDLNYKVGSSYITTKPYTFSYLSTLEKKQAAVDFLKKYILVHLSKKLRPFSWLVVGNIYGRDQYNAILKPYAVAGERCIALAYALLPNFKTEAKKQEYANRQLLVIINNMVANYSTTFNEFKEVSNSKYSNYINVPEGKTALEVVRENGFLTNPYDTKYMSYDEDVTSYISLVISNTDEKINTKYGEYPKIIEKAQIFKKAMEKLGYTF